MSATAVLARMRFGSSEVTAPSRTWSNLSTRRDRSEDCSTSLVARKDGSHNAPSHQRKRELTESANRSIARRAPATAQGPDEEAATSALTNSAFS
jgi:hypothetical protein